VSDLEVVEICAGAGGQALGLELAGFHHELAVELDQNACNTLLENRAWKVVQGDVADRDLWNPADYEGIALLAGGVPCPPFTIAGKQLGATDERDLFAWAIEQVSIMKPRALLLENVRGLSLPRFAAYRQHVLDRLNDFGYVADWKLLQASDYGVSQLRPRFVLVAMKIEDFRFFEWPCEQPPPPTVGETLQELMAVNNWRNVDAWVKKANDIAPTIVGGSKKHGGADLGPTRAKRAWAELGVDALGVANAAPERDDEYLVGPKLTCKMVARLQGWDDKDYVWNFTGRKTSTYRQIGNAFPPPVARAVGSSIVKALKHEGKPREIVEQTDVVHDPVYKVMRANDGFMTMDQVNRALERPLEASEFERHISHLRRDFAIDIEPRKSATAYRLGSFKAFLGQEGHMRNEVFQEQLTKIS
jgi:DNA (cytosine-5)-methyltransferase 1